MCGMLMKCWQAGPGALCTVRGVLHLANLAALLAQINSLAGQNCTLKVALSRPGEGLSDALSDLVSALAVS